MKPELENKLYEKYPKIFKQKDDSPQQTAMCWGIACSDGWYSLIDRLCSYLQYTTDKRDMPQVEAVQVKEKFGGLRFYVHRANEIQYEVISFAEHLSFCICEWCGLPAERGNLGYYIVTLCKDCRKKGEEGYRPWRNDE